MPLIASYVSRWRKRHHLTPRERANMRSAKPPVALFTASLGGHLPFFLPADDHGRQTLVKSPR
jgi:hypothetical protein